ncbi:MAG: hypothetical protein AAGB12_12645 [Pseudomonadota bacterium]
MNNVEKRQLKRLLCSDNFSMCFVEIKQEIFEATPINFNRAGMSFSTPSPLPDFNQAFLSFTYGDTSPSRFHIEKLLITVHYAYELDVCSEYKCRYVMPDTKTLQSLIAIEEALSNESVEDGMERYGIHS